MLDFDSIQNALQKLGATADACESHGTLCGLLLDNPDITVWLAHTLEQAPDEGDVLAGEALQVLVRLFEQTREQLNTDDLSFELLLPEESDDFAARLLGLSSWCQGFLYGIGVSGGSKLEALDPQSQECLSDLLEISKLNHREVSSDESEARFTEVCEHVRMSVLMLNETMNPLMPAPSIQ
jgi:yecA family protein